MEIIYIVSMVTVWGIVFMIGWTKGYKDGRRDQFEKQADAYGKPVL